MPPLSDPPPPPLLLELHIPDRGALRLTPGKALSIGRSPENDLVLEDSKVSREHARLEWAAGAALPSVVDLGSANGVTLDGERVRGDAPLGERGTLGIGTFQLRYALQDGRAEVLARGYNLPEDSGTFELERRATLAGSFEDQDELRDFLRGLERAQRSGTLHFDEAPMEPCWVTYAQGRVMNARYGKLEDLDALERVLQLVRGRHRFTSALKPCEGEFLDLSITEFLERGFF
ncbi:MAG: FHA domain-containing protein [Planctomycetota bacterium]